MAFFNKKEKTVERYTSMRDKQFTAAFDKVNERIDVFDKRFMTKRGLKLARQRELPGRIERIMKSRPIKMAGKVGEKVSSVPASLFRTAKGARRMIKSIPKPIRGAGLIGTLGLGAVSMLGVAVLKGAMNQGRQIAYERYMMDQATNREVLAQTRLGNSSGTNRMLGYGGTVGLSNSLSRTRHGR